MTASLTGTSAVSEIAQGDAARDSRHWAVAEECYRRALSIDSSLAHIWIQLGHALKEQGNFAEAEEAYRRGTQLAPDESDGFLQLGHLLKRDRCPVEALEAYRTAFRLDPSDTSISREIKTCERLVTKLYVRTKERLTQAEVDRMLKRDTTTQPCTVLFAVP
jgi:cytochrome c-type biogenesis protein CcmH/NrfG